MTVSHFSLSAEDLNHVLAHTRDLWEDLRGQRLFLTGGTGFFGMWLVESFLWANERLSLGAGMVVLTRQPEVFRSKASHLADNPAMTLHAGRMEDFAFPRGDFSHVIHAATEAYVGSANRLELFERDTQGTRRLLEFTRSREAKRVLLTSSGAVYGRQPSEMTHIPEEYVGSPDTLDARSGYGQGKRVSEFLSTLHAEAYGLDPVIARCFAFVGPYLPLEANYAIGNFLRDALAGEPIRVNGDGTPYRSYLYAADLAVWLWTVLLRGTSCRAYNVGSDQELTIAELAREVARAVAPGAVIAITGRAVSGRAAERYVPAIGRAREELGLRVRVPLPEAIRRTAAWYRQKMMAGTD